MTTKNKGQLIVEQAQKLAQFGANQHKICQCTL